MPRALSWRAASSSSRARRLRLATKAICALPGFLFAILLLGTSTYADVKTLDKLVFTWRDVNVPKCKNLHRHGRAWAESGNPPATRGGGDEGDTNQPAVRCGAAAAGGNARRGLGAGRN